MSPDKLLAPGRAVSLALVAYLLFTIGDSLAKWLQGTYHYSQILLTINLVGFVVMAAAAIARRGPRNAFKSRKWGLHALRGSLMAFNTIVVLYALKTLPLADFYGIVFQTPIWVALLSVIFLREHIPPSRWVAIFVGFIGVLVIAGAEFATFNLGFLAAVSASVMSAASAILARHIGREEAPTNFALSVHAGMIVMNACILPGHFVMPTWQDAGLMAIYAVCMSVALLFISTVFARSEAASQVAPLQYTQMLWGILIGWIVFDQVPALNVLMGAMLVIGAGIYILRSLRRGRVMTRA